jgi:hypothetical protein
MCLFRGFVAVIATLIIFIVGNVAPAYAGSMPIDTQVEHSQSAIEHKGNNDSYYFNNSFNHYERNDNLAEEFGISLARGLGTGVGVAVGATVGATATCYVLDGIATMFFPPAAVLAPTCGYVGGLAGGGASAFSLAQ